MLLWFSEQHNKLTPCHCAIEFLALAALRATSRPNHPSRSLELLILCHVSSFKGSINRSMAKLNKDTKTAAHLSATLDIFSRCLSSCNCKKVIWNDQREQLVNIWVQKWIVSLYYCQLGPNLFLQFFFCRLLGLRGGGVSWAVGTNIILQPIHWLNKIEIMQTYQGR